MPWIAGGLECRGNSIEGGQLRQSRASPCDLSLAGPRHCARPAFSVSLSYCVPIGSRTRERGGKPGCGTRCGCGHGKRRIPDHRHTTRPALSPISACWRRCGARRGWDARCPWAVTFGETFVGQVSIGKIAWGSERTGYLGAWIDSRFARHGITKIAVAMAMDHCFQDVGLHRIVASIRPENTPSRRGVEKLGFRCEGHWVRQAYVDGEWRDHLCYALTAEEVPGGLLPRCRSEVMASKSGASNLPESCRGRTNHGPFGRKMTAGTGSDGPGLRETSDGHAPRAWRHLLCASGHVITGRSDRRRQRGAARALGGAPGNPQGDRPARLHRQRGGGGAGDSRRGRQVAGVLRAARASGRAGRTRGTAVSVPQAGSS
jgi:hypothetical protein